MYELYVCMYVCMYTYIVLKYDDDFTSLTIYMYVYM